MINLPNIAETIVDDKKRATRNFSLFLAAISKLLNRGFTGTIVTAPLTGGGTTGSMTFQNGVLVDQVAAT